MKIKELHLRNIASIETANINFEKDLNDAVTGDPASIFLISGDTGAGKSIILDGISLALYKKTPRLEGVVNKKSNEYTDHKGESVSVNSIEQYTRLGISENDDCYSELIFEGNDGKIYSARLQLGMIRGKTDATGKRPLKYGTPQWEYKVGTSDWAKVDAKAGGEPLLSAVGLSFEQFGRMAMLAQGQFASFLTGDKKERVEILEQLTNTEIFSTYGEAIKRLFNNASNNKKEAESAYKTELSHTKPQEEIDALKANLQAKETEKNNLNQPYTIASNKLKLVEDFQKQKDIYYKTTLERQNTQAIINSENYTNKKNLIIDWENSENERAWFNKKRDALQDKTNAESSLNVLLNDFQTLSADIEFRKNEIATKSENIHQLNDWIDARKDRDALFASAESICVQLNQYFTTNQKIADETNQLNATKAKTEGLKDSVNQTLNLFSHAKKLADAKQTEIDNTTKQRNELNPSKINADIQDFTRQNTNLSNLKVQYENLTKTQNEITNLGTTISQEDIELQKLQVTLTEKVDALQKANETYVSASNLLSSMEMSMDKRLKELRKQLRDEHAKTCPLCGQEIKTILHDDDFSNVLSPLQEEKEKIKSALTKATQEKDTAKEAFDTLNGSLETKKKKQIELQKDFAESQKVIKKDAQLLGLDVTSELLPQIMAKTQTITTKIETLVDLQRQAESLQSRINELSVEKKSLDANQASADREKQRAEKELEKNTLDISNYTQNITNATQELEQLKLQLQPILSQYYPTWEKEDIRPSLTKEAKEYIDTKERVEKSTRELNEFKSTLTQIQNIQSDILKSHSNWNSTNVATKYNCPDIIAEWNALCRQQGILDTQITTAQKIVDDADVILSKYYTKYKKTEENLKNLINQQNTISSAREFITNTNATLQSLNAAIKTAEDSIAEILQKLNVTTEDEIPNKEELTTEIKNLNEQIETFAREIGGITEQLKENNKNQDLLIKAQNTLAEKTEIFNKWDKLNKIFGGDRFRTLVQTYILRPLLNNANIYLEKITDRYKLTCSEENEQLSILVLDRYNKDHIRSVTVLSGGERFMISLALSLALSSLNRSDMNVNILFIDEGFGTLDEKNLDSVMSTLEKLQEIAGQSNRRVGIISHREELADRIPVKINVKKKGEGRSVVEIQQTMPLVP